MPTGARLKGDTLKLEVYMIDYSTVDTKLADLGLLVAILLMTVALHSALSFRKVLRVR